MKNYRISVRDLVEFVLRSGDIDTGSGDFIQAGERALLGTKLHRKIQNRWTRQGITTEVFLAHKIDLADYTLTVEGRADGIDANADPCVVYEIKTVDIDLGKVDENYDFLHWAQAYCYAYIYALQNGLDNIEAVLVYCQVESGETLEFRKILDFLWLEAFFQEIVNKYNVFLKFSHDWAIKRNESIRVLTFPFSKYRKGQEEMCEAVYDTIRNRCKLFVQAPTGTGKTMSAIFPAIKSLGAGLAEKVFYLTAKTTTRLIARDAVNILREKSLDIIYITLYAKEKICPLKKPQCNPVACEYARGHYDRINPALLDALGECRIFDWDNIMKYAGKHRVCPYEFSLDLALWCDVIICDYNYLFDPRSYLRRFFSEDGGDYVFLVDEAHNLVDRAREMFSAVLYEKNFINITKYTKKGYPYLTKNLAAIRAYFQEKSQLMKGNILGTPYYFEKSPDYELGELLEAFILHFRDFLEQQERDEKYEEFLNLYFDVSFFLKIMEIYDENFCTYISDEGNGPFIKLFCVNPSKLLEKSFEKGVAAILFSATLIPMDYFYEILGGNENDSQMILESPFIPDNKIVVAARDVLTTYNRRAYFHEKIADYIKITVDARPGNYFVFFPSYKYMRDVYEIFRLKYPDADAVIQDRAYTDKQREEFINSFEEGSEKTRIGFCVLGGVFSEGIDLKDDRLIGAIIVGVGLPQVCLEREIIRSYYSNDSGYYSDEGDKGYNYAYVYPGITKVFQAAGRVIRTENDRGVILLLDERFSSPSYRDIFPGDWQPVHFVTIEELRALLDNFWI